IFVLESAVFALIGLELPTLVRELGRSGRWPLAALAVTATLMATRVAWVFPVFAISGWRRGKRRPSWPAPAAGSWAGAPPGVAAGGGTGGGGAAGGRPVLPPPRRRRGRAATAGSGAGTGRRHDRDLVDRAGIHPGAAGPPRRVRPSDGRARPRRDRRPAAHGR